MLPESDILNLVYAPKLHGAYGTESLMRSAI